MAVLCGASTGSAGLSAGLPAPPAEETVGGAVAGGEGAGAERAGGRPTDINRF